MDLSHLGIMSVTSLSYKSPLIRAHQEEIQVFCHVHFEDDNVQLLSHNFRRGTGDVTQLVECAGCHEFDLKNHIKDTVYVCTYTSPQQVEMGVTKF